MGLPCGKGNPSIPPILIAKMGKGQEIDVLCKAYKVIFWPFCVFLGCRGDAKGCHYRVLLSIMPNGLPYQL